MCKILMIYLNSSHVYKLHEYGHGYVLHKYNIFSVLIFFCIRGYQRDNLEFSANYLYNYIMCCKQEVLLY